MYKDGDFSALFESLKGRKRKSFGGWKTRGKWRIVSHFEIVIF